MNALPFDGNVGSIESLIWIQNGVNMFEKLEATIDVERMMILSHMLT